MDTQHQDAQRPRKWLIAVTVWGGAFVVAACISYFSRLNFWICLGIVAVAWVINGIVATIEDHMPGGFLNPGQKSKEP
jgi:hypothetical protein